MALVQFNLPNTVALDRIEDEDFSITAPSGSAFLGTGTVVGIAYADTDTMEELEIALERAIQKYIARSEDELG